MRAVKLILAVLAVTLAFDNLDRGAYRTAGYWGLVCVYWICNALGA